MLITNYYGNILPTQYVHKELIEEYDYPGLDYEDTTAIIAACDELKVESSLAWEEGIIASTIADDH